MSEAKPYACIRIVPIFNHLTDDMMDKIGQKARHRHLKKGEYLYQAGDSDDSLYVVNKGTIRVTRMAANGKEQLVRMLYPGDFTGEWTIFDQASEHEEYAEAIRETNVCIISRDDMNEILEEHPTITRFLLKEVANRLMQSERQAMTLSTENVLSRLVYFIEQNTDPELGNRQIMKLPMARKDIAAYLGTTPETVSRKFKELEEAGLILQLPRREIEVLDLDGLLMMSDR